MFALKNDDGVVIFHELLMEFTKAGMTPVGKWYYNATSNPNPPIGAKTVQDLLLFELQEDG